jgi:hypothetical protein
MCHDQPTLRLLPNSLDESWIAPRNQRFFVLDFIQGAYYGVAVQAVSLRDGHT